MAIKPPVDERTATSAELDALYAKHDVEKLLTQCKPHLIEDLYYPDGHPCHSETIHKHGVKWKLYGKTVAVIFHYTHINKTVTRHIRMLRIDNVRYSVERLPPVSPAKV